MTTADVEITERGALLKQDGKILRIENLSHPDLRFSVISLDPPPLVLDRKIKGLKRIELRIPSWTVKGRKNVIKVKLTK